jgi:predicted XRE-type DNA-binding protein
MSTGSGNVFTDLGFADADALLATALLTYHVYCRLTALGPPPPELVTRLGLSPAEVSQLLRCKCTGLSRDRLMQVLAALGV